MWLLHFMAAWWQSAAPDLQSWSPAMMTLSNIFLWERYARLRGDVSEIKRALKIRSTIREK